MPENIKEKPIKLVLGIGNPGAGFNQTYHNVGICAVEHIAKLHGANKFKRPSKRPFEYSKTDQLILAKSSVFMNHSGRSARAVVRYFRIHPQELLLLHDDSDLLLGFYKLSFGQGAAGHNGVLSVMQNLGTKQFWRGRIGVRRPDDKRRSEALVLNKIRQSDLVKIEKALNELAGDISQLYA